MNKSMDNPLDCSGGSSWDTVRFNGDGFLNQPMGLYVSNDRV